MKKLHSKGFGVVEVLIIIVVVGLLAAAGWFIWNRQNADGTSSQQASTQSAAEEQLVINEWKVQATVPAAENGTSYTYLLSGDSPESSITFSFPTSDNYVQSSSCDPATMKWGLARYRGSDLVGASGQTYAQMDWTSSTTVKKVGDYYYQRTYPQFGCSDGDNAAVSAVQESASIQILQTLATE